jgi:hypothetical protein
MIDLCHKMATFCACLAIRKCGNHVRYISENRGSVMAQAITSWFISDGRFRVHAINAVGRRSARIVEIEDVDTGERFHGSARKLQSMFQSLGSSGIDEPATLPR